MRNFFTIWRRELSACFLSPIAYVTMVVFLGMSSWTFLEAVKKNAGTSVPLQVLLFVSIFFWLPILITVITMRLFAEEKRSGTIETLMTAPVTDAEVVLGKYAGAVSFLLFVVVPGVAGIFLLAWVNPAMSLVDLDLGAIVGGGLILLLLSAFCLSIGLVVSLLTKNQIVAGICCFGAVCLPFLFGYMVPDLPVGPERVVQQLSAETHILAFSRGSVDTRPIVLYFTGTVFMLFTATRFLESRRWR